MGKVRAQGGGKEKKRIALAVRNVFSFNGIIWSILQQGTEECVVLHAGIWQRGGGGREDRTRQANRACKGRRSFMICGEAGHKQGSQLPGLLIQHPQIKPGTGKTCDGCQGRGCISLAFLSL